MSNNIFNECYTLDDMTYTISISESSVFSITKNSAQTEKSFKQFIKNNEFLKGVAIRAGLDSLSAYHRNKNMTARFFAKTTYERVLYKDIANRLVKSGEYKLMKNKYINGGILYELVKI